MLRPLGKPIPPAPKGPGVKQLIASPATVQLLRIEVADTVGAGDAFAAAFVHGLGKGWPAPQIADFANRVGALVASRPGAIPPWTAEEASALMNKSRRLEPA
jgi:sugar/nucleoside kinase (ribokinase family)